MTLANVSLFYKIYSQAISRRIHYGKFVAEAKFRESPRDYEPLIRAKVYSDTPIVYKKNNKYKYFCSISSHCSTIVL